MKFEVKVDDQKYMVEAPSAYEAKLEAIRQHMQKYPGIFASTREAMSKAVISVNNAAGNV